MSFVTSPDPRKWTPETRAAYAEASGLRVEALVVYERMHDAWLRWNLARGKSKASKTMRAGAYLEFVAARRQWTAILAVHHSPLFAATSARPTSRATPPGASQPVSVAQPGVLPVSSASD